MKNQVSDSGSGEHLVYQELTVVIIQLLYSKKKCRIRACDIYHLEILTFSAMIESMLITLNINIFPQHICFTVSNGFCNFSHFNITSIILLLTDIHLEYYTFDDCLNQNKLLF